MLTIDNFDTQFSKNEVQKGRHYFDRKAVLYAEQDSKGVWQAEVEGTETYSVEVELKGSEITETFCDCPVEGPYCKHVIAVLFAIRAERSKPKPKKTDREPKKLTIEGLLAKTTADELRQFLIQYAATDKTFASRLQLHFADKDERIDVAKQYTDLIKKAVKENSDRGFVDYRATFRLMKEVNKLISSGQDLLNKGNFRDAIAVGKVIATEMMEVIKTCDDSAGNIGGTIWSGMKLLHDAAKSPDIAPPLREQLYEWAAQNLADKIFADYGDYDYELLNVAQTLARQLPDPNRFLTLLDTLTKRYSSQYDNYRRDSFAKTKIKFLTDLGRTAEAEKLVEQNLDVVEIRDKVLDKAIADKQWERVGELIQGGIQIAQKLGHPGTVSHWEKRLLEVARLRNDTHTVRRLTKQFTFDRHQFDGNFYRQWKETFSAEEWPDEYASLIRSIERDIEFDQKHNKRMWMPSLPDERFRRLMPLFRAEKRWADVLPLLQDSPSIDHIQYLHDDLAALYPAELLALYLPILTKWGKQASTRPEYNKLAQTIKKVRKELTGSHEALDALVAQLRQDNPRKPAFLEELNEIYREPKKRSGN